MKELSMKENNQVKKWFQIFLLGLIIMILVACKMMDFSPPGRSDSHQLVSNQPRQGIGDVPAANLNQAAQDNNTFAFDLYQQIRTEPGNLFYSPFSISAALAMTYAGAQGQTAEEMASTMHFALPQDSLHPAFNALDQYLAGLADMEIPDDEGDPFQLNIANALWGQKDFHFEDSFLDTLGENYGAGLRLLDYILQPEESRLTINQWVSDQTEERIQDLIPQGAIDSDTRLVLSNAIYFKAAWLEQFAEELTEEGIFHGLEGEEYSVQMMRHGSDVSFPYYQAQDFQVVELPYIGGQVSMLVLMPDQGEFEVLESVLSDYTLNIIMEEMVYTPIRLTFPSFEFETDLSLAKILTDMGMPTAFSDQADFSGMTGSKDLFISDVFHKAYLNVKEEGTEAAAATAVLMKITSAPMNPVELVVDRPFLFFIREHETNTILFMGRVVSP
jgi:serpin B